MARKKARALSEKRTTGGSESNPMDLAAIVSGRVQIRSLIIAETIARRTTSARLGGKDTEVDLRIDEVGYAVAPDNEGIVVTPTFSLDVRKEGQDDPMLSIRAKFVVTYTIDKVDDLRPENLKAFAGINGVYNTWPYWREFVQSTVARMGLAPLTIPVFRLPDPTESGD